MLIHAGFEAAFDFAAPTTVLLMGNIHPTRTASIRRLEPLSVTPAGAINCYFDLYGNQCGRTYIEVADDDAAEARLANIPEFVRPMARTGIERFARERGAPEVDEKILDAARDFFGM